jgi:hypothetical protein
VITDHYVHVLQKEFLPFLLGMGVNFGGNFFKKTGHGHTLQMQGWMYSMRILTKEFCLIVNLNGLDMGGPGHHVLQILTHATISYGAF